MKALIVEDIPETSALIKNRVTKLAPYIEDIDQVYDLDSAYTALAKGQYQLVFMDIQLPKGTSFDILKKLAEQEQINFEIIFITGQMESEFIMNAIKFSAIDYLNKPLEDAALLTAITKAHNKIEQSKNNERIELLLDLVNEKNDLKAKRIAIHLSKGFVKFFDVNEITHLVADGVVTKIMTNDGKEYVAVKNLGFYKSFLVLQYEFYAISQSTIVNMQYVSDYNHRELSLSLKDGTTLLASRRGGKEFRKVIEDTMLDVGGVNKLIKKLFK